jgi:hypothetical protein
VPGNFILIRSSLSLSINEFATQFNVPISSLTNLMNAVSSSLQFASDGKHKQNCFALKPRSPALHLLLSGAPVLLATLFHLSLHRRPSPLLASRGGMI